ncbi:hypothetical protein MASR2M64_13640 [Candidatus Cloacimonadota bacterium]
MKKFIMSMLVLLLLFPLFAVIEETASLKNFLLGTEPNCAYDKWVSHLAEGIALPGYNTYAPYDRQLNGFGNYVTPTSSQLNAWGNIVDLFLAGEFDLAQEAINLAAFPYQVVLFHDTDTNRTYHMLREVPDTLFVDDNNTENTYDDEIGAFAYSWGIYIYNPAGTRPIVITAPHPNDDFPTPYLSYEAFQLWNAKFMMINGAGREVKWTNVGSYNNSKSLSDPTRVPSHPFNTAYFKFADKIRVEFDMREFSVQIHSYDWNIHTGYASNQISAGNNKPCPNLPIRDLSSLKNDLINRGSDIMIPANTIGIHSDVHLNDYYGVYYNVHDFTFDNGETEYAVNPDIDLPAYTYNQEMLYTLNGWNDYDVYDPFFHVEMDELPNCYAQTENTYKWFYGWDENLQRWDYGNLMDNFKSYYARWIRDLDSVLDDMFFLNDNLVPTTPLALNVQNQSLTSITLNWTKTDSYDFDTYEVLYATEPITDTNFSIFSRNNNGFLASPDCEAITVTGLDNSLSYFFKIRAKDKNGVYSTLSNEVTTIPAPANVTAFKAYGMDAGVRLYWTVSGQVYNQGFKVYRKSAQSEFVLVDSYLTNTVLSNSTASSFEWWDYNVVNGETWTYVISSTNLNNTEFFYNYPSTAAPLPIHKIFVKNAAGDMEDSISMAQNPFATDAQDSYYDVSKNNPSGSNYVWNAFWEQYWGNNGTQLSREVKGGYNTELDMNTWIMRVRSTLLNQPLFISASEDFGRAEKLYLYDSGTGAWHNLFNGAYEFTVANSNARTMTIYWGNLQPKVTHSNQNNRLFQGGTVATFYWSNTNSFLIDHLNLYIKNAADSLNLATGVAGSLGTLNYTLPQEVDMQNAKFMIDVHAVDGVVTTYESPYTFALLPAMNLHFVEQGWQTRSTPWINLNPSVTDIFGIGSSAYTPNGENEWLMQENFLFGTAYWVSAPEMAFYSSNTPISTTEVTYAIQPGWNFIPNPHLISYPLSSLRFTVNGQLFRFSEVISQKLVSRAVYVYRDGKYIIPTEILPYESFYVKYYGNPTVAGYISFYPYFDAPGINPPTSNWQLQMQVSSPNNDTDSFVIGTNPIATDGYDFKLDLPTAPAKPFPSMRAYLTREAPEDFSFADTKLQSEFRAPFNGALQQDKIYNFAIEIPSQDPVTFTMTGTTIPAEYTFSVVFDNLELTYSQNPTFTFDPPNAGTYTGYIKVYNHPVGNSDLVQAPISALVVYPNPFNPSTTLAFTTPRSLDVSVDLFNIRGQKVRNLHRGNLHGGQHKLVWDGKDDSGRGVGSGIYFARINAGSYVKNVKMVLMK